MPDISRPAVTADDRGANIQTAPLGNLYMDNVVNFSSSVAVAKSFSVHWDGDKVRGVLMEMTDGTSKKAGDYQNPSPSYTVTTVEFAEGELLDKAWLRSTSYGGGGPVIGGSVRQIEILTKGTAASGPQHITAGQPGFEDEIPQLVEGSALVGFCAWVNPDNFISGLALWVRWAPGDAPAPAQFSTYSQTKTIGNPAAGLNQVPRQVNGYTALYLGVRWDGDKIRSLNMVMNDGMTIGVGDSYHTKYPFASYTFGRDEWLTTLTLWSSSYGHGSLRRIEFTTNQGGNFAAGELGGDSVVIPQIDSCVFLGMQVWDNADNFVNALAFEISAYAEPRVLNFSPWTATYSNNAVTVDGNIVITIADAGLDDLKRPQLLVSSGKTSGYCSLDGFAPLTISIFADATFEAKFPAGEGEGAIYGPLEGLSPSTARPVLIEALVRKYAPAVMLNADEVYWPSDIVVFLKNMKLQTVELIKTARLPYYRTTDVYPGPLDRKTLTDQAAKLGAENNRTDACLSTIQSLNDPSSTLPWFNGSRPSATNPVTAYAVVVEGADNGKLDIVYWWFFNYNQGKDVANTSWGNHVADWEHVKVQLGGVDFTHPGQETVLAVMYDHHGDKETHPPADGISIYNGKQVLVYLSGGDHEAYPRPGSYKRPAGTYDICSDLGFSFDQRTGNLEIYTWKGSSFVTPPAGASAAFMDPSWISYYGRWGNWERGALKAGPLGEIAQLESGPEGLFRPGEYPSPT